MSWEINYYKEGQRDYAAIVELLQEIKEDRLQPGKNVTKLLEWANHKVEFYQKQIEEAQQKELEKVWKASPDYPIAFEAWLAKQPAQASA